jgi:thiamine biosynthesis lipoprotein
MLKLRLVLLFICASQPVQSAVVVRSVLSMGTELTVLVEADTRAQALEASQRALEAVDEAERRLSTWEYGSELSRFNRSDPGTPFPLTRRLASDLSEARHWWRATEGAFSPAMAPLVKSWGLRGAHRVPEGNELERALDASHMGGFDLDGLIARREHPGFEIDEGGFGKGVGLRDASFAALESGATCVLLNFGGQVHMSGGCPAMSVAVADPDNRGLGIAVFRLAGGSAATTGNSERGVDAINVGRGHILDPRTGHPAPDFGSVTVAAADPVAADCLATALFVMGPKDGLEWVEAHPGVEAVYAVRRDDGGVDVLCSSGLSGRLLAWPEFPPVAKEAVNPVVSDQNPPPPPGVSGGCGVP